VLARLVTPVMYKLLAPEVEREDSAAREPELAPSGAA
jgi:hypothetical protein